MIKLTVRQNRVGPVRGRVGALVKMVKPKGIYERSDVRVRGIEGETGKVGVLEGEAPEKVKIREGVQGYRRINELALRLLPLGGILVPAFCSAHLSLSDFRYMLSEAAGRAGRTLQILETYTHGVDHPELVAFTEGEYLKCVFAIVN